MRICGFVVGRALILSSLGWFAGLGSFGRIGKKSGESLGMGWLWSTKYGQAGLRICCTRGFNRMACTEDTASVEVRDGVDIAF